MASAALRIIGWTFAAVKAARTDEMTKAAGGVPITAAEMIQPNPG